MEASKSRALGTFERAQVLTAERFAFNLVLVIRLAGALRRGALRSALDELQRRHALLRTRIERSGRRRRFELGGTEAIPLRSVQRRHGDSWQRVVESELGADLGAGAAVGEPLARCVHIWGDDGAASDVVLTLHHAIVDAVSALRLVRELLALCAGAGARLRPEESLPASADQLFPRGYRAPWRWPASARFLGGQLADEAAYRWRTRRRQGPPSDDSCRCRVLSLALGEDESTAFVRATRRQRVGVGSALSAAMLLAVVHRRYDGCAGPHRYFVFPLLRPYLSPPVPAEVVAGYLTTLRFTLPIEPAAGFWSTADRIHRQTDLAIKRGDRFLASCWSAFSMAALLRQRHQRMGTTALNYVGATSLDLPPGTPFSVSACHAFVSNFSLGPEYTAQARIFRRRLRWDIVYLDVDMDREEALAIAEEMRRSVVEAADQSTWGQA